MKPLTTLILLLFSVAAYGQNLTGLLGCTNRHGVDSVLTAKGYTFSSKSNATGIGKCFATAYYTHKKKQRIVVRLCNDTLQSVTIGYSKAQWLKNQNRFVKHFGYVFLKKELVEVGEGDDYWEYIYQSKEYPHITLITFAWSRGGGEKYLIYNLYLAWDNEVKGVKF